MTPDAAPGSGVEPEKDRSLRPSGTREIRAAGRLPWYGLVPVSPLRELRQPRSRRSHPVRSPFLAGVLAVLAVLVAVAVAPGLARPAGASANSDRGKIAQLERRIADDGARVQELVAHYNQTEARASLVKTRLAVTGRQLAADRAATARTARRLRQLAIAAYVSGGSLEGASVSLSAPSARLATASVYANVAAGRLDDTAATYRLDRFRTASTQASLEAEQAAVEVDLRQLAADQQSARSALASDQALLGTVQGNLQRLLIAAEERSAAAQSAAEQALATPAAGSASATLAASASSVPLPGPAPAAAGSRVGGAGYADPLRAVAGLAAERVDQGVDFGGSGPIYALGDGTVLSVANAGWPGGTFIAYRLTDGPAAGLVVYAAEDIFPTVQVGQSVTPSTVLGTVYAGPEGIETGWASSGGGDTMAMVSGQFSGGNSTAFGVNFSQLLSSLGAPGGVLQNDPPTGAVPPGWPTW